MYTFGFFFTTLVGLVLYGEANNTTALERRKTECTLAYASSSQGGCSTSIAEGLTYQIIEEMTNMGYKFNSLNSDRITCTSPCVNQLQEASANALADAVANVGSDIKIILNSATRSSAQQYILYNWYLQGYCGIGLAAVPGTSNHEGGRAIDTSDYTYWEPYLADYGWKHSYPDTDPVHFDYTADEDLARYNLEAFQRLWNKNNNEYDQLVVDGIYGDATAEALSKAPCDGW
jgi:N-acetylmuramoyl-L-alanine amidase